MTRCLQCRSDRLSEDDELCPECGVPQATLVLGLLPDGHELDGGRYVIKYPLGRGGFGVTYRAFDTKLNQIVAVKELFPDYIQRDARDQQVVVGAKLEEDFAEDKREFLREGRLLAAIEHPSIVGVETSFEEHGTAYMVMELLVGETLEAELGRKRRLKEHEVFALAEQVCSALAALHARDLLHLDLQPSSLFRRSSGEVLLIEFGASKCRSKHARRLGSATDAYVPLEQLLFAVVRDDLTPGTDVYSLAMTFVELLTGRLPPSAQDRLQEARVSAEEVTRSGAQIPDVKLEKLFTELPSAWARALQPALAFRVERRTRNVDSLMAAIEGERERHSLPPAGASSSPPSRISDLPIALDGEPEPLPDSPDDDDDEDAPMLGERNSIIDAIAASESAAAARDSAQPEADSDLLDIHAMASALEPKEKDKQDADDILSMGGDGGFGGGGGFAPLPLNSSPVLVAAKEGKSNSVQVALVVIGVLLVLGIAAVVFLLLRQPTAQVERADLTTVTAPGDLTSAPTLPGEGDTNATPPVGEPPPDEASETPTKTGESDPSETPEEAPAKAGENAASGKKAGGGRKVAGSPERPSGERDSGESPPSRGGDENKTPDRPPPPPTPSERAEKAGGARDLQSLLESVSGGKSPAKTPDRNNELFGGTGGSEGSNLPQKLNKNQVIAGMRRVSGRVSRCGAGQSGRVTVTVVISGASGRVKNVNVTGMFAGTPVGSCAARAVRAASFPRFRDSSLTISGYGFDIR